MRNREPAFIIARYPSKCAETGRTIAKGERCAWYPASGRVFAEDSKQAAELRGMQFSQDCGMADGQW